MGLTDNGDLAILADPASGKNEVVVFKFTLTKTGATYFEVCKRDPKKSTFTKMDFKAQNKSKDDFVRLMGL